MSRNINALIVANVLSFGLVASQAEAPGSEAARSSSPVRAQAIKAAKVEPSLRALEGVPARPASTTSMRTRPGIRRSPGTLLKANPRVRTVQPKPSRGLVSVKAYASGSPLRLAADLRNLGMKNVRIAGRLVSGRLPVGALSRAGNLASLRYLRSEWRKTAAGSVTGQGDIAQASAMARSAFGLTGRNVRVGILSDSFDALGGGAAGQASGDLPSSVTILSDYLDVDGQGHPLGTDEGRAMAEIVHDVAPEASIAFHTAFNNELDFASGIRQLYDTAACNVIVDDVVYFDEPMFADGVVAQSVDYVVSRGVAYFSSAGNRARKSFEDGPFRDSGFVSDIGEVRHNFDDSGRAVDTVLNITLHPGVTIFVLQWNQAYASTGGDSNPGATGDFDIFLTDPDGNYIEDPSNPGLPIGGFSPNVLSAEANATGEPIEIFGVELTGADPTDFGLTIEKWLGDDPTVFKLVWYEQGSTLDLSVNEYPMRQKKGTVYGHAGAAGANAVGAVRYYRTPAYGFAPPLLEPFSSGGGTVIYYDTNGKALAAADHRLKPEFCAPDGGDTSFFGVDFADYDGWPNFFGTSAAAPHAAGVAALLLEHRPELGPAELRGVLESTALPAISTYSPAPADHPDPDTGFGLIQADSALAKLGAALRLVGDLDGDGCVGTADLAILQERIQARSTDLMYDLNQDGVVDIADARFLAAHFSRPGGVCPDVR